MEPPGETWVIAKFDSNEYRELEIELQSIWRCHQRLDSWRKFVDYSSSFDYIPRRIDPCKHKQNTGTP